MKKIISLFAFVFLLGEVPDAQSLLPMPRNYEHAYNNGTRSATGRPGDKYWQNHATYNIQVNFSPTTRIISGAEEVVYTNNSPDTLEQVWFKLYPNLYQQGVQRDLALNAADVGEGVRIEGVMIDDKTVSDESVRINGTNMQVATTSILPGEKVKFNIHFSYILNKTSHTRTGMVDEESAFIAYFFPRIAVYDDVDGWNRIPYQGTLEFYNDFCDFDVAVTVPQNYIVHATGTLANPEAVLQTSYIQRIKTAEQSDGITKIIDTTDLAAGNITLQNATNTWVFHAENVTDFAFATSNHYVWYASSIVVDPANKRRTRVDAVFNPEHKDFFEVVDFARQTVDIMSYTFPAWPFPYEHETVFDGLDQMEYPMMVNDNPLDERDQTIELTDHEIFHTMFPFYMGTNETRFAWMDEGWATLGEWLLSPMIDTTIRDDYGMGTYNMAAGSTVDLPITTLSTQTTGTAYFTNAYPKPALGYLYLKDMLGDSLFLKGLHYYIDQWHGKHPIPYDFFYCMNTGTGKNLNWFWQSWFMNDGYPDLALESVKQRGNKYTVTIASKGSKPVPVHVTFYFKDGSTERYHQNISCWQNGNKTCTFQVTFAKELRKVVLGDLHDADIDASNNVYETGR